MNNLAVGLEKCGPEWLSLADHLADRPLHQIEVNRAGDSQKYANLPPGIETTRFLRKPYIELASR
ncbi:hypothetical protein A5707_16590 [Mycobacterium kyorinense]|uniref:Uncharacterized protein n=1 Tax=Mycobacterium kyorinense TaxID=487514 RepID=A0A1A2ZJM5_9MYCO|nr:hypothetical protein A5707_16590 [Mycobacterium kyorinense]